MSDFSFADLINLSVFQGNREVLMRTFTTLGWKNNRRVIGNSYRTRQELSQAVCDSEGCVYSIYVPSFSPRLTYCSVPGTVKALTLDVSTGFGQGQQGKTGLKVFVVCLPAGWDSFPSLNGKSPSARPSNTGCSHAPEINAKING